MEDFGEFVRKHAKILIVVTILAFILLGLMIVSSFQSLIPESGRANLEYIKAKKFQTIIELLEYYECEFVTLERSAEKDYVLELHAKVKVLPYEGLVSNEDYYMVFLNDLALFYDYDNFVLVDDEKELKIKVMCENQAISKITVNGIEDYFNKKKEELRNSEYEEIPITEITINSQYILDAMNNDWSAETNFGTKESIFGGYDIYFDEGIEVRKIQGKVYNIIFKNNYKQPIVNGLTVDDALTDVRKRLGKPAFEDNENDIIGYKGKDIYIFFSEEEVSVYRKETTDVTEVIALIDKFKSSELDLLGFMNELTYTWPDYNEYIYTASSVYISYPLKGFEIKINYENDRGFYFYNNFNLAQEKILKYLDSEDYKALLKKDSIFIAETRRLNKLESLKLAAEKMPENILNSSVYDVVFERFEDDIVKVSFISKDGSVPNRELNDSIDTYGWVSDNHFVFSKMAKGIYCVNMITGKVQEILSGNYKFNITKSEQGYIAYDDKEQRFEF